MKITLNITHRCNLNCRYCYSGRKFQTDMSHRIGMKSIDFAFDLAKPDTPIEFSFFGGEPLLCFSFIQQLAERINAKASRLERQVSLNMTTNATLLDQAVLAWIDHNQVDICVSIDGPEKIHNANRRYADGRGSFSTVLDNLRRALDVLPRLQVNAVYGPATTSAMAETLAFFINENIPVVHFNPDIRANWDEAAVSGLTKAYHDVAETYIEAYRRGREVAVNLLDSKMVLFLKGGYSPKDICGMGIPNWPWRLRVTSIPVKGLSERTMIPTIALVTYSMGLTPKNDVRCCRGEATMMPRAQRAASRNTA